MSTRTLIQNPSTHMIKTRNLFLLSLALAIVCTITVESCNNVDPVSSPKITNGQAIAIGGQVVYRDKDGGFYGILADNGGQFEPILLDQQFKTDGARIKITGTLDPTHLGKHGWGNIVDIQKVTAQ